jgi:hypothetical protein
MVRTFGRMNRSEEEISDSTINLNDLLGINNFTMCHHNFPDPYSVCTFIDDHTLFVALFYNYDKTHYHFFLDLKKHEIIGEAVKVETEYEKANFPFNCFYNDELREVYLFYRQGHSFIIEKDDPKDFK